MRPRGVPVALFLLLSSSLLLQVSGAEDLYWEGEEDASNEFLEVKEEDFGGRIKRHVAGFFDFFSSLSSSTTTTEAPEPEVATDDPDVEDVTEDREEDLEHGSGLPDRTEPDLGEKTLRVNFVVMEPYQTEFSNRDSIQFQNFSRSLADAVNLLYENLPGTQRASLVRIQSRVSDEFSCKVTLDIVTTGYDNTDRITAVLQDHIRNRRKLGSLAVSDADFGANVNPGLVTCDSDQIRCSDDKCVPGSSRCNGIKECFDGEDELNCPSLDWETADIDQRTEASIGCERNVPCASSSVMICSIQVCDGVNDCPEGDDEFNCEPSTTVSKLPESDDDFETTTTVSRPRVEEKLPEPTVQAQPEACPSGYFSCDERRCLPFSSRCDGFKECSDGVDEAGCAPS